MSIKQESLVQQHKGFYKREASSKANSDKVPPGLLSFSLFPPSTLRNQPHLRHEKARKAQYMCVVAWQYAAEEAIKGHFLQWPHSDKDLWCVENRVGWAPSPLLELWLLMHQTLPPCPALCQRHISPPIGPFQQIRCFENDFQGAVGSHSDDIKWKEQKRKKKYSGW